MYFQKLSGQKRESLSKIRPNFLHEKVKDLWGRGEREELWKQKLVVCYIIVYYGALQKLEK